MLFKMCAIFLEDNNCVALNVNQISIKFCNVRLIIKHDIAICDLLFASSKFNDNGVIFNNLGKNSNINNTIAQTFLKKST